MVPGLLSVLLECPRAMRLGDTTLMLDICNLISTGQMTSVSVHLRLECSYVGHL